MKLGPKDGPPSSRAPAAEIRSLVVSHWDSVYRLLYRLTRRVHETEDLTQETFTRALERSETFAAGTNLRAWLMRIATNAFLDRRRREKTSPVEPLGEQAVAEVGERVGESLERREQHEAVLRALMELPDQQRAIFLLRSQEDLSFKEIAELFGTTEPTARWHMMQARKALLQRLSGIL